MNNILTNEQVALAIFADGDFPEAELERLSKTTSTYIHQKTGYDFSQDPEIHPHAIECAIQYVKSLHFNRAQYNKQYDFAMGISSYIIDLQRIANERLSVQQES